MASDFLKLDRPAQRAAFAHMSKSKSGKKFAKGHKSSKPSKLDQTVQHLDANGKSRGRISFRDAAVQMYGPTEAAKRIAAYEARQKRKR